MVELEMKTRRNEPEERVSDGDENENVKNSMAAFKIFMEHVKFLPDGSADAAGIFTPTCFNAWLNSRTGKIQHPEQTFHRTLVAHIRGKDTRRPFPENVEVSMLHLLRESDRNIFDLCFLDDPERLSKRVGKHGFKHLGFHEEARGITDVPGVKLRKLKRKRASKNSLCYDDDIDPLPAHGGRSSKGKTRSNDNSCNSNSGDNLPSCQNNLKLETPGENNNSSDDSRLVEHTSPFPMLPYYIKHGNDGLDHESHTLVNSLMSYNNTSSRSNNTELSRDPPLTPLDVLLKVLKNFNLEDLIGTLQKRAVEVGMQAFPPAVAYLLKEQPAADDPRLDFNFIFPSPEYQVFRSDVPVGHFSFEGATGKVLDANAEAETLLGPDINGKYTFMFSSSLFEMWYTLPSTLMVFQKHCICWKRTFLKRKDGTNGLFLMKVEMNKPTSKIWIQDITDLFPHAANMKPFFI